MTLRIINNRTNKTEEFHYQDAIIDGDLVYLGRISDDKNAWKKIWNREDITIEVNQDDHVYTRNEQTGALQKLC